ncbi:MAG: ATP-binding protein [Candidatus Omnitrophota bacterium]
MSKFLFPSNLSIVKEASHNVLESLSDLPLDAAKLFDLKLSFEEAMINAIKYGNREQHDLNVEVEILKHPDSVEIIITDQGKGFDYQNRPDPTADHNLEKRSGRGIFLINQLIDRVVYEKNGSCIHLIKNIG